MSKYIDIQARDQAGSFKGYLALPPEGKGPGICWAKKYLA